MSSYRTRLKKMGLGLGLDEDKGKETGRDETRLEKILALMSPTSVKTGLSLHVITAHVIRSFVFSRLYSKDVGKCGTGGRVCSSEQRGRRQDGRGRRGETRRAVLGGHQPGGGGGGWLYKIGLISHAATDVSELTTAVDLSAPSAATEARWTRPRARTSTTTTRRRRTPPCATIPSGGRPTPSSRCSTC